MSELGKLISEHKENTNATGSTLIIGFVCFGMTALMAVFFFGENGISFNKVLFGACAVFALLGGIGCVQSFLKNSGIRVEIYENGLVAKKDGKTHTALWKDISDVKESVEPMYMKGVYVYDRYLYTIEKKDGETFELSNMVSDIDKIGEVLKTNTLSANQKEKKDEGQN